MAMKFDNILVPITDNIEGEHSFKLACVLAKPNKSTVHALYVIEVSLDLPLDAEMDSSHGESILQRIEAIGNKEKCKTRAQFIQARHAGPAIIQEALTLQTDLIVVGSSLNTRHDNNLFGSTPFYILKNSPCPVILWNENNK